MKKLVICLLLAAAVCSCLCVQAFASAHLEGEVLTVRTQDYTLTVAGLKSYENRLLCTAEGELSVSVFRTAFSGARFTLENKSDQAITPEMRLLEPAEGAYTESALGPAAPAIGPGESGSWSVLPNERGIVACWGVYIDPEPVRPSFSDVEPGAYYADAVSWAAEENITAGTSDKTFSPAKTCTVAQVLTFLWRACGQPEPEDFTPSGQNRYYEQAAAWARQQGLIPKGVFRPEENCTRAMAAEFLWKAAGKPAPGKIAGFRDVTVGSSYARAVSWAVEKEITRGTAEYFFAPGRTCTRAEIVTFLYRAMGAGGVGTGP